MVETDEDRPRRYMFADLGEVSSPEHWMRGNHFADSCSEADDLSIDEEGWTMVTIASWLQLHDGWIVFTLVSLLATICQLDRYVGTVH